MATIAGAVSAAAIAATVLGLGGWFTAHRRLAGAIPSHVAPVRAPAGTWLEALGRTRAAERFVRPELLGNLSLLHEEDAHARLVGTKATGAGAAFAICLIAPMPAPILAPLVAIAAWRVPDVRLARRVRGYRGDVDREVPHLVDVLAMGSMAGLSAPAAVREARSALCGPLADELERALRGVDLGSRWRDELGRLADRLALPDVSRTVATLTRTEDLGVSLADPLARLSRQVRDSRRLAEADRARKAPIKMLFPLVFLILPAFLLLTVVPVLISTVRSI